MFGFAYPFLPYLYSNMKIEKSEIFLKRIKCYEDTTALISIVGTRVDNIKYLFQSWLDRMSYFCLNTV